MQVTDFFYCSMVLAWILFLVFFGSIKEKIGMLIWPLSIVFGGFMLSVKSSNGRSSNDVIEMLMNSNYNWGSDWIFLLAIPPTVGVLIWGLYLGWHKFFG